MNKKMDRRVNKTRKSIKQSFITLLSEKDMNEITITELANHADINRKTFYAHYSSVSDILESIGLELKEKLVEILPSKAHLTLGMDLSVIFKSLNKLIEADLDFYKKIICSNSYQLILDDLKTYLKEELMNHYTDVIKVNDNVLAFYTEFLSSGIVNMYVEWFKSQNDVSLDELGQLASEIVSSCLKLVLSSE